MRNFETDFDFDFEEGAGCRETKGLRDGDTYPTLAMGGSQVFTAEREARIKAHCKRVQAELKRRRR